MLLRKVCISYVHKSLASLLLTGGFLLLATLYVTVSPEKGTQNNIFRVDIILEIVDGICQEAL